MKFILTKELGRLARWLRILGYDTLYFKEISRSRLIMKSLREDRLILTRSSKLSRSAGLKVLRITEDDVRKQLAELIKKLELEIVEEKTFERCIECNEPLNVVGKEKVKDQVPPYIYETQDEFKTCYKCKKVFWRGSHWGLVKEFLENIKKQEGFKKGK